MDQKRLGQYFTVSSMLQDYVFDRVKYKGEELLEPSFGAGHLLKRFVEYKKNYPMICFEIDSRIKPVIEWNRDQLPIYGNFMEQNMKRKFKTIVGNPPFVKTKGTKNLYIHFIEKCFEMLDESGEIIFIVPSDFIKLTSAVPVIEKMCAVGSFTDFLFPHDEGLFDKASVDVMVFRYEKGLNTNKVIMNGEERICNVNKGVITFSMTEKVGISLSEVFNVYVGMVTGRDGVYKKTFGNMDLLVQENKLEKFIYVESYPSGNQVIDKYLMDHKDELLERKIRKFNDRNWFEWGAPRNVKQMKTNMGRNCIYIKTLTRDTSVAFIGKVQYYGGTLLCLIPKTELSIDTIKKYSNYFNSASFKSDYMYSGRFKIGQRQLCNAIIPRF